MSPSWCSSRTIDRVKEPVTVALLEVVPADLLDGILSFATEDALRPAFAVCLAFRL